jgi:cytochrome c oxidase subunit 2
VIAASGGALDPAGPAARVMADLWWLMLWLGLAVFVLFVALMVMAVRRHDPSHEPPEESTGTAGHPRWLVLGGVVLPVVVILVVLGATLAGMNALPRADAAGEGPVIELTGHQWWWEVRYRDHDVVTANEIHVPVGVPVTFVMSSDDVVHSFWVPELGGKLDLIPERETTLVLQADEAGEYRGSCAEFCGLQHARMLVTVVAEDQASFDAWLEANAAPAAEPGTEAEQRGLELLTGGRCVECHTVRGTAADGTGGPDLTHLASRSTLLTAWPNTEAQLEALLRDPHEVKEGIDMEPGELTDAEIADLVAYLRSLR